MEYLWNDPDGKPKYLGRNLCQCYFVHHKSHIDWWGSILGQSYGFVVDTAILGEVYVRILRYSSVKCLTTNSL
jgi:hypothetical protein